MTVSDPASVASRPRPVLGVFGGSFDPPHLGHAMVPAYLFARGVVDQLIVAPVADHPFGKSMRAFDDRLLLTRAAMAAMAGEGRVEVTDLEQRLAQQHGGPSRTLRLLDTLQRERPDADVRLVVGSDIVADGQTDRWHRWDEIERRFSPIVVPRAGATGGLDGSADASLCALPAVSSTEVRGRWERYLEHRRADERAWLAAALPARVLTLLEAMAQPDTPRVWIVGQGHVSTHAAPWLRMRGIRVTRLPGRAVTSANEHAGRPAPPWPSAVWVLVRDSATATVATALRDAGLPREVPVLHGAGAVPSHDPAALGVLAAAGHPVGTLHPICSLRKEQAWPSALPRAAFGLEGDAPAREVAQGWLGHQPWVDLQPLDAGGRRAYHAACALAANHLAVLQSEAGGVLRAQGYRAETVDEAMAVLLRSSLANLLALGIPAGITGPVSRGDEATVAAHVAALPPQTANLYQTLSERLARIVAGSG